MVLSTSQVRPVEVLRFISSSQQSMSMASTSTLLTNVISISVGRRHIATVPSLLPLAILFSCLLVCSGCWFKKVKPVAFTPPPPHAPAKIGPPPVLAAPPELAVDLGIYKAPDLPPDIPDLPEPPKPAPRPK